MTRRRTLLVLCLVLMLLVGAAWLIRKSNGAPNVLVKTGAVSHIAIMFHGRQASFVKLSGHTLTGEPRWALVRIDHHKAADPRVNTGLLTHMIDLVRILRQADSEHIDQKNAAQYGLKHPELAVRLSWDKPKPGFERVIFGNPDLSGVNVFALLTHEKSIVLVPAPEIQLLRGKTINDFRDQRITTFAPDDVEDFMASGKCRSFKLSRDGDHWVWGGLRHGHGRRNGPLQKATNRWLSAILSVRYDKIEKRRAQPGKLPTDVFCSLYLDGLNNTHETIYLQKYRGSLWAVNTNLPARYRLPVGVMRLLIPPN